MAAAAPPLRRRPVGPVGEGVAASASARAARSPVLAANARIIRLVGPRAAAARRPAHLRRDVPTVRSVGTRQRAGGLGGGGLGGKFLGGLQGRVLRPRLAQPGRPVPPRLRER